MTQTLLVFAGVLLLVISAATLLVAVRTLRTARAYVDLAEERLEHLREGQARLLAHIEEQRRLAEERREEVVPDIRTREGAGRSIERTRQRLLERREVRRPPVQAPEPRGPEPREPEARKKSDGESSAGPPKPRKTPPPGLPETRSPGTAKPPRNEEPPRRAVARPHPDDDVKPAGKTQRRADPSPTRMFRVFYDRYLDNYEGYVKLAERLHAMRTEEEKVAGSRAERDWHERLRRVNDGIGRTTARLDILEHANPELASDDRVSRRAAIARTHARFTD